MQAQRASIFGWRVLWGLFLLLPVCRAWSQPKPPGFPAYEVEWLQDTLLCDYLYLTTERFVLPSPLASTAMLVDRRGFILWAAAWEENVYAFGPQADGSLTFCLDNVWYALDSNWMPQALPTCGSLTSDFHDYHRLPNGHHFELCSSDTVMDLSGLLTYNGQQGDSAATVQYSVVRELDAGGTILREWRGIDHFLPSETDHRYFLYPWFLELNHTNSIDFDGQHLLLSHRNNHAVTLTDWATGTELWQLGGDSGRFYFLGDQGFEAQHDARFVSTDTVSLLDNRSLAATSPRAVVYALDTALGLATLQSAYVQAGVHSRSMGSYQVLPTGEGLVSWGTVEPTGEPNLSYFDPLQRRVCDIFLQAPHHCYRAECGPLTQAIPRPSIVCERQGDSLLLRSVDVHGSYLWNTGAITAELLVADTGYFQLYVPLGVGYAGSNVVHVRDLSAACPTTAATQPLPASVLSTGPRKRCDLLGRPLLEPRPGQLYLEYDAQGRSRKVWCPTD